MHARAHARTHTHTHTHTHSERDRQTDREKEIEGVGGGGGGQTDRQRVQRPKTKPKLTLKHFPLPSRQHRSQTPGNQHQPQTTQVFHGSTPPLCQTPTNKTQRAESVLRSTQHTATVTTVDDRICATSTLSTLSAEFDVCLLRTHTRR